MYRFLKDKNFSPNGHDVTKALKGDEMEVPAGLVDSYLENKVIEKVKVVKAQAVKEIKPKSKPDKDAKK